MGEYSGGAGSIPARRKPVTQVMDQWHAAGLRGTTIEGECLWKAQPFFLTIGNSK